MTNDEPPEQNVRNALALLMAQEERFIGPTGTRVTYDEDAITAVKARLWRAVEQLEQKGKVSDDA